MEYKNKYMANYMKLRRVKRREKVIAHLGGKCSICGTNENLEINHINPKEKSHNIGDIQDGVWEKIIEELEKCELLCVEHHKQVTKEQYKKGLMPPPWNKNTAVRFHGSARKYSEDGCRCEPCIKAKKLYRQKKIKYSDIV